MKKILVMAKSLGGGGSEVALTELLNKIDGKKYEVTLVLLDEDDEYKGRLKKTLEIKNIQFKNEFYHTLVSMYSFIGKALKKLSVNYYIPYYDWLMSQVTTSFDEEYDIAIDFYGYGYFMTGFLAKKIKAGKKATWLHGEDLDWFSNTIRYMKDYDKIFCVSESVRGCLVKQYPFLEKQAEVFLNVIDTKRIIEKSKESVGNEMDGVFNILSVGRLHNQKGFDIAIESASLLKDRIPFKWYVIGAGQEEKKLKRLVGERDLCGQFIFLGHRENPYPYMSNCDLYVQTSRHEGYGITIVEARVLRIPMVISDIKPYREQIIDGETGYLVPLIPEKIAEKILELYDNRELLKKVVHGLEKDNVDFSGEMEKLYSF